MKWTQFILKMIVLGATAASGTLAAGGSYGETILAAVIAMASNGIGQFQDQPHKGASDAQVN